MPNMTLTLAPHEEVMINGALVENGDAKAVIRIETPGAHILTVTPQPGDAQSAAPDGKAPRPTHRYLAIV